MTNSVDPDTLSQGQVSDYTMRVSNTGEAWIKLTPQTTFRYNDAKAGDTVSTHLTDSTLIGGMTSNVLLNFDPVRVPYTMAEGDWQSRIYADGVERNGYSSSPILVADLVTIQERPQVVEVGGSLSPNEVSRGQTVAFTIDVVNTGGVRVVLNTTTRFRFTDGAYSYQSFLSGAEALEVGVSRTLTFGSATVPLLIAENIYPVSLYLNGMDDNGAQYTDTVVTTGDNQVNVERAAQLEILAVQASDDTVSWGEGNIPVDVVVQNSGGADAWIDSTNLRFYQDIINLDSEYSLTLLNPISSLSGGRRDTLNFRVAVDSPATPGWVTLHARIFGRDANSNSSTSDTTAAQPDSWFVQGPAELACSLWAVPDTVIIGQTITLSMRVDNTGGAYADSVVPSITKLGNGTVSLVSGPTPPSANIGPGSNTVFNWIFTAQSVRWVYWRGDAAGEDHNSQEIVLSNTDTSNVVVIQIAPSLLFIPNTVEPDTVTQNQTTGYTLMLQNQGEAWLKLIPDSTLFSYNDGTGDTVKTFLLDSVRIRGGETSLLEFDAVRIPLSMDRAGYRSRVAVTGRALGIYPYHRDLLCDSVIVVEGPRLVDIANTLDPDTVSQGQNCAFSIDLVNQGGLEVVLTPATLLEFTDGSHVFQSSLPVEDTIGIGEQETLNFNPADVPAEIAGGSYPITLKLHGYDQVNPSFRDTMEIIDRVVVQTRARLEILTIDAEPDTVGRSETNISVAMTVGNSGQANALVDSASLAFFRDTACVDTQYVSTLVTSIGSLPGLTVDTLEFRVDVDSLADYGMITIDGRIYGRDVNSNSSILDTEAAQPDSWFVQGPVQITCRIWAEPDTVIISQDIHLHMEIENTGGAFADSVVPFITLLGDGSAILTSGPIPSYANIAPQGDTTFNWTYTAQSTQWVYWTGYAVGRDRNTDSTVTSDTASSNSILLQTPPVLEMISNTLDPDTFTQNQIVHCSLMVRNLGEAWVELIPDSTILRFSDTDGDTAFTSLVSMVFIDGLSGNTPLVFDPMRIPPSMEAGDWRARLDPVGRATGGYRYTQPSIPIDWVTVQDSAEIRDVANTLLPEYVTQGQDSTQIVVRVENSGGVNITLNTSSSIRFSDGTADYEAFLSASTAVPSHGEVDLRYRFAMVHEEIAPGLYRPTFDFRGTDSNGKQYNISFQSDVTNAIQVQTPPDLVYVLGSLDPLDLIQGQEVSFQIDLENIGQAGVILPRNQTTIRFQDTGGNRFAAYLADTVMISGETRKTAASPVANIEAFPMTPSPKGTVTLNFLLTRLDSQFIAGAYRPEVEIDGVDYNGKTYHSILYTDSLEVSGAARLLVNFDLPPTVRINEIFQVTMEVTNNGGAGALGVVPSPERLDIQGNAQATYLSGPSPLFFDLPVGSTRSFTWEYRAGTATGWVNFSGRAVGVDETSLDTVRSVLSTSPDVLIELLSADEIRVDSENRAPTSCVMGERDILMLDFDLTNVGDPLVNPVKVTGFIIRIEDEATTGIVPSSALSRLSILDYSRDTVIATASAPGAGNHIVLTVSDALPLYVRPGETDSLGIFADIAANAQATAFRVNLADTMSITAGDSTCAEVDSFCSVGIRDMRGAPLVNMRSDYTVIVPRDLETSFSNYPNPFAAGDEVTYITYNLPSDSPVTIKIYTLIGKLVWTEEFPLGSSETEAGILQRVTWDGRNQDGEIVRNGIYVCKIEAGDYTAMTKIAVAK